MADFPPYKSEVDQILAEAMDHCVLEQVAAINCSSFSHSLLPSHLETRFQKLKTLPSDKSRLGPDAAAELIKSGSDGEGEGKLGNSPHGQSNVSKFEGNLGSGEGKMDNSLSGQLKVSNFGENSGGGAGKMGSSQSGELKIPNFEGGSGGEKGKKGNSQDGYRYVSPSDSSSGHMDSPKFKGGKHGGRGKMGNSQPGSGSFCSDSEEETERRSGGGGGCLCFSPTLASRNKKKNSGGGELGFDWGKDKELLSDLRSFSSKQQKKRMKEAMKEEEKIIKEAEKIVKWAKQVSSRMDFEISDDDELSDDLNSVHHFGCRH